MGLREYGFLIRTAEDAEYLHQMLLELNKSEEKFWKTNNPIYDTGSEMVYLNAFLNYRGDTYVCIGSGGGNATDWIENYYKTHGKALETYYPWEKPEWWFQTEGCILDELSCDEEIKTSLRPLEKSLVRR
mmetsp:Transcript_3822/g.7775  ORF Transcript_3822/g.7775 Transcript_3822/m.7775 type:complete len:130 (-) Transcript_3822:525-914(-)